MEILRVIMEIGLVVVILTIIIPELEKEKKYSTKSISPSKIDATHHGDILETKLKIQGIIKNQESIDTIAENVITLQWIGYEQIDVISYLVKQKYKFNSRQLDLIFTNTTGWYCSEKSPLAFLFARAGYIFSIDMLLNQNNPVCGHGWTIAHEMANQKHRFSVADLELLGNPADLRGLTISDTMILTGHQFTEVEKHRLGIDYQKSNYTAYATYNEDTNQTMYVTDLTNICIKCGGEFSSTDLTHMFPSDQDLYSKKLYSCSECHWWILREHWVEDVYGIRDIRVLFIGVPKLSNPDSSNDQKPWEKFLSDKLVYHHALKITDEIESLFPLKNKQVNQSE